MHVAFGNKFPSKAFCWHLLFSMRPQGKKNSLAAFPIQKQDVEILILCSYLKWKPYPKHMSEKYNFFPFSQAWSLWSLTFCFTFTPKNMSVWLKRMNSTNCDLQGLMPSTYHYNTFLSILMQTLSDHLCMHSKPEDAKGKFLHPVPLAQRWSMCSSGWGGLGA